MSIEQQISRKQRPPFHDRTKEAIEHPFLQKAVRYTQDRLRGGKKRAEAEIGNWEEWRLKAEAIRRHTVEHLDVYLDQFTTNVENAGGTVHFADTSQEVLDLVTQIVRKKEARSIVKSKSMVSEEVDLNHVMEQQGVEVVESDLGEYIVQLADEAPSHIIVPAIHKNRQEITRLFSKEAGKLLSEETAELTAFARKRMREKFLQADIGITGCNFGVAESGSVVLVTNEGNARMSTTLPDTHIVVMGMERIAPRWRDLDVLLTMLTRSATGQKITSYVTALTGPRREGEADGPKEMHVIVVDNGRSSMLGTGYQDVLHCIRCGACINVCPVYRQIGGHAYGGVYPGPIGAVLTPLLEGFEGWTELPYASSLCGACTDACPVRIPLHERLLDLRADEVETKQTPWSERLAFKGFGVLAEHPEWFEKAAVMGHWMGKPLADQEGFLQKGPGPLKGWTDSRDLPIPAKTSFRKWWRKEGKQDG
ncbi:LutB/LldF family L-lactate oxidation iron-sulfur protein [Melghirimyces algeriensis]|uniref:L-lactate dehydrogenase complex protein LldF n=1 Tax=Melghirimyces algeriensis TaxID=910412 RepID=A0A521AJC4_9BACL|nr:LutB/LldF family L-lactate oxidation iron-sulfur protein [Melghirimyces algeriensis]SMO34939.1 L-lactate dehydrogenase complex protein LldF [Melghirimyces algeriensis]